MSRYYRNKIAALDNMRARAATCPWCYQHPDKPQTFENGSRDAKRLLRKGKVRIVNKPIRFENYSITRTYCGHICHWPNQV